MKATRAHDGRLDSCFNIYACTTMTNPPPTDLHPLATCFNMFRLNAPTTLCFLDDPCLPEAAFFYVAKNRVNGTRLATRCGVGYLATFSGVSSVISYQPPPCPPPQSAITRRLRFRPSRNMPALCSSPSSLRRDIAKDAPSRE